MDFDNAIELFIVNQQLKGNTNDTIRSARERLHRFYKFYGDKPVEDIILLDVNKYHLHLRSCGYKNITIKSYLVLLRTFLSYMCGEGIILNDFTKDIQMPKVEKPIKEILTNEEIKFLLGCFNTKSMMGLRNYLICALMLDCGIRKSEVENLKAADINHDKNYLKINGKGRKQRIVPIGLRMKKMLMTYQMRYRKPSNINEPYFLLDKTGKRMSKECIKNLFARLKIKTGIPRLHAHLLRHTFATNFLTNELGTIYELSLIMGHEDVKTTEVYLNIASYYNFINAKHKNKSYLDTFCL